MKHFAPLTVAFSVAPDTKIPFWYKTEITKIKLRIFLKNFLYLIKEMKGHFRLCFANPLLQGCQTSHNRPGQESAHLFTSVNAADKTIISHISQYVNARLVKEAAYCTEEGNTFKLYFSLKCTVLAFLIS